MVGCAVRGSGVARDIERVAPAAREAGRGSGWFIRADLPDPRTSNLAAGRSQPVATPDPARPVHRIKSVWVRLVTMRQKLDCFSFALIGSDYWSVGSRARKFALLTIEQNMNI